MRLGDMERSQIKDLLAQKRMAELSENTVLLIRVTLSVTLAEALDTSLTSTNPAALSRRRGQNHAGSNTATDRKEVMRPFFENRFISPARCLPRSSSFSAGPIIGANGHAARRNLALKWTDLGFNKHEILIERALSGGQVLSTKTGEPKHVHIARS
jgi:hypothetical protein